MQISLLISSGDGPEEYRQAVAHIVARMNEEAEALGLAMNACFDGPKARPASVIVVLEGVAAEKMAAQWLGTVLWRQKSKLRPEHRRANWFVGVFALDQPAADTVRIDPAEVRFSSFRAGGPGGQHQNTTDSAVRAEWRGITAVSRDERSQHRNKAVALQRLQFLVDQRAAQSEADAKRRANLMHKKLQRGAARRVFQGDMFVERRCES